MPFTAQAESGSVSPADGSLLTKTELPVCCCLCFAVTIAHADAVAGIGIGRNGAYWAGQLPCFYECQAGEQCRRMTALRKCGGAMCGCQC